jgi:type IV pilus assembly protein PilV
VSLTINCRQDASVKRQQGFSLLEVLVTMVVVALGLLGVAGMQVAAIKLSDAADSRSRGATYVSEIVERMMSNPTNANSYAIAMGGTVSGTDAAALDLTAWKANLQKLPSGDGSVAIADDPTCTAIAGGTGYRPCRLVTVTVQWDESRTKRATSGTNPGLVTFTSIARI